MDGGVNNGFNRFFTAADMLDKVSFLFQILLFQDGHEEFIFNEKDSLFNAVHRIITFDCFPYEQYIIPDEKINPSAKNRESNPGFQQCLMIVDE